MTRAGLRWTLETEQLGGCGFLGELKVSELFAGLPLELHHPACWVSGPMMGAEQARHFGSAAV